MADVNGLLADPDFNSLDTPSQKAVLARVDPEFAGISDSDYQSFRQRMGGQSNAATFAPPPPKPPLPAGLAPGTRVPGSALANVDPSRAVAATEADKAPFRQIGQGVQTVRNAPDWNTRAQGASDVLRGGMGVAAKALPAVAPLAPASTAAGLAAGTIAGMGTEAGLNYAGVPSGYSALAGTAAGIAAGGLAAKGVAPLNAPGLTDPHVAALRAWGFEKDPRILDQIRNGDVKLTSGLSDLKATGNVQGPYANESVLDALPQAKEQNRAVWQEWMNRAQGQVRMGTPIVQATTEALKSTINDPRAQTILEEANRMYNRPLSPQEMEQLLVEKNAELKSFYSGSKEVQAAAERAGADTLKSKPLLQAQANALRDMLNRTLDPEHNGAAAAELQGRYGALKAIEEAANARRTDIIAEHPVNQLEKGANIHLDPRAAIKAKLGSSEWLIEHAIQDSPEQRPLPRPTGPYPINPRQIAAPDIVTPPPADTSGSRPAGMPPGPQANVWQGIGAPKQLEAGPQPPVGGPRLQGAGVGSGGGVVNVPPAQPMDLSIPPPVNWQRATGPRYGAPGETIGGNVAKNLGKSIWNALNPPGAQ